MTHRRTLREASTLAGNMSNSHVLSQAEQILLPHSNAMIEAGDPVGTRWGPGGDPVGKMPKTELTDRILPK